MPITDLTIGDSQTEIICAKVYRDSKIFFERLKKTGGGEDWYKGYQILLGPPCDRPPIIFIGYQPGKGIKTPDEEREYGSEDRWPHVIEYATEDWILAKRIREMFDSTVVRASIASNAVFARAFNIEVYERDVPNAVRRDILDFCIEKNRQIIEATKPKMVVCIGLATLKLFSPRTAIALANSKGRALIHEGEVFGRRSFGILHLSGSRISKVDKDAMAIFLKDALKSL